MQIMSYNKIEILERCNQMFLCSICCDPRISGQFKPFGTYTASLFLEHQRCYHPSVTEVDCVYCCCRISSSKIVQHIQNHFLEDDDLVLKCPICQQSLKLHWQSTIEHMESHHSAETASCPHCRGQFHSIGALQEHILDSQLVLFQCPSVQCLIKTHSKAAILAHLNSKHNGSRCIIVRRQYLCTEGISRSKSSSCECYSNVALESPKKYASLQSDECQLIDLPYSSRVLTKLSIGLDERLQEDLCSKMEQYAKFKVRLEVVDGQKQFVCSTCQYRSVHSLADVRKHILGCHCSVSTSYTRLCLRASRLDTNNFSLFSDRKLISFANEKLKRTENGSSWEGNCDYSGLQLLDDSEQESGSNSGSLVRSGKRPYLSSGQEPGLKKARIKQRQSNGAKMRPDSPVPEVGPPLDRSETFDRVIQLNYSWSVLERLVLGQCPERYLPVLRQKMDVYSQHRILLTRRNGKRYFLCSHCPNCSPHGMNDIRKHILGVHARLPERFKSAAMYCSRMNRDNYGLLSDEELLKKNQDMVRWRATPSQGAEDFGMEPLAPLRRAASPEEASGGASDASKSHNVFLSGEHGECSPPLSFPASAFTGHDLSREPSEQSSPPADDLAPPLPAPPGSKGRSRRSLVLKSKCTSQHHGVLSNPT